MVIAEMWILGTQTWDPIPDPLFTRYIYGLGQVICHLSGSQIPTYLYKFTSAIPSLFFLFSILPGVFYPRTFAYAVLLLGTLTEHNS